MTLEFWFAAIILPLIVTCLAWGAVLLNQWHDRRQDARCRSEGRHRSLEPEDATLVSKATLRAAAHLGLPDPVLATILSLSASSIEGARDGQAALIQDWRVLERVIPLIRLSRALDHGLGGDSDADSDFIRPGIPR